MYSLIARATDGGGRFCQSNIRLILEDVNDNPPVFSSDHYNACVYENTATKALLTRVQAVDPDDGKSPTGTRCLPLRTFGMYSSKCYLLLSFTRTVINPLWLLTTGTCLLIHILTLQSMHFIGMRELCKVVPLLFLVFEERYYAFLYLLTKGFGGTIFFPLE